MKSKGLGDSIEKFTKATGIHSLAQMGAKAIGKKDCGCKKRKKTFNDMFPYKTDNDINNIEKLWQQ